MLDRLQLPKVPLSSGTIQFDGAEEDITAQASAAQALRASEHLAQGQLAALTRTLAALAYESDLGQLPKHVLDTIATELDAHSVTIWESNGTSLALLGVIAQGHFQTGPESRYFEGRLPIVELAPPLWMEGLLAGHYLLIGDIDQETSHLLLGDGRTADWSPSSYTPAFGVLKRHLKSVGVRTLLIMPMLMGGNFAGIIGVRFTVKRTFRAEEIELTRALAHQAMLAMKLMRLSEKSRELAIVAERNRMARDLHDTLAQGFTGVIVQLEAAEDAWGKGLSSELGEHVSRARDLARESLQEARRSALALRPRALAEKNVCEALGELISKMTTGTSLRASIVVEGASCVLNNRLEGNVLRIGQEVLTNTLRHARAGTFRMVLTFEPAQLVVEMGDDGAGFDPAQSSEGLGLLGIRERVEDLGGTLMIQSAPGKGTTVHATLPFEK